MKTTENTVVITGPVINLGKCTTFLVEGSLETAGDVDNIAFMLANEQTAWLDSYESTIGTCSNADIVTEVRAWRAKEKLTDPVLLDLNVPCQELSDEVLDLANGQVCGQDPVTDKYYLGCGSCDEGGKCGQCDDDSGYGKCTRMYLSNTTVLAGTNIGDLEVRYAGRYQMIRVYAISNKSAASESRAAPTSLAVEIAEKTGLTLVGFVRGERMNVYAGRQRLETA